MDQVWMCFTDQLYFVQRAFGLRIRGYVLLHNHFHMILSAPDANLPEAMRYFVRELSRSVGKASCRINHVFGNRYHRSALNNDMYYFHAYKYLFRNPVEAGLCDRVERYRYSSLPGTLGMWPARVLLEEDTVLFDDVERQLEWLNTSYKPENKDAIRKALKRSQFSFARDKKGRVSPLETMLS